MFAKIITLIMGFTLLFNAQFTLAGDIENSIIAKISNAYGGKALSNAHSINITDFNKGPWPGQSENPGIPEIWRINEVLTIDFENKRKSMLSWRVSRSAKDLDRFVFDGKKGRIDDILNKKYATQDWLTYDSTGRSVSGRSDTMIVHGLMTNPEIITTYEGDANYRGAAHQKLTVNNPSGGQKTLYVHKDSGLISKVIRQHPRAGELVYIFSNHKKSNGVSFAQDMNFFVGGELRLLSIERSIEINPSFKNIVFDPVGFDSWGETFDDSKRFVREVEDKIYHVGKGGSYSMFVDVGDYFIASGGNGELKNNFGAVKNFTGVDKPLKYWIATHHHSGEIRNAIEAVELGASIVTVNEHLATIKKSLPLNTPDNIFTLVKGNRTFGNGAVKVYDIATAHSEHYLVIYAPKAKVVFAESHYGTELKTAIPRVHKDMVTFLKAIDSLNIKVDSFLDGYGRRQLSMEEFRVATDAYIDVVCPKGYKICEKG